MNLLLRQRLIDPGNRTENEILCAVYWNCDDVVKSVHIHGTNYHMTLPVSQPSNAGKWQKGKHKRGVWIRQW